MGEEGGEEEGRERRGGRGREREEGRERRGGQREVMIMVT